MSCRNRVTHMQASAIAELLCYLAVSLFTDTLLKTNSYKKISLPVSNRRLRYVINCKT